MISSCIPHPLEHTVHAITHSILTEIQTLNGPIDINDKDINLTGSQIIQPSKRDANGYYPSIR